MPEGSIALVAHRRAAEADLASGCLRQIIPACVPVIVHHQGGDSVAWAYPGGADADDGGSLDRLGVVVCRWPLDVCYVPVLGNGSRNGEQSFILPRDAAAVTAAAMRSLGLIP